MHPRDRFARRERDDERVQWGNVKAGDTFITRNHGVCNGNDVWLVLEVGPSPDAERFVQVRYVYIHDMDGVDSISTFSVDPADPVDYDPLFGVA